MPGGLTLIGTPVTAPYSNTTPQNTGTLDSTNAVLFILELQVSPFFSSGATVTDSKGNTLTAETTYNDSSGLRAIRFYRCIAPATKGTGHFWTVTGSGSAPSGFLTVYAYSDTNGAPTRVSATGLGGASTSLTSIQPGSITPPVNSCLCVCGVAITGSVTPSVDSGYTVDTSNSSQLFTASQIQATATPLNPTWSWTGSNGAATNQIVFQPAAGGGGGSSPVITSPRSTVALKRAAYY